MDNFILKDENAVFYECGYSCDNEIFIKIGKEAFFITDARYCSEAREIIKNAKVIDAKNGLIKEARLLLRKMGVKNLYFNPNDFSVADFKTLSSSLNIMFKSKPNFSQLKRIIKSPQEIEILKKTSEFGANRFDELSKFIQKNGLNMSEEELNFNAQNIFRDHGKFGLSFEPIIAINANAAKAHALPTKTRLKYGDLLLVDAGIKFKRYCSDRTRMAEILSEFNFEKDKKFNDAKKQDIYNIVKEAQENAIKAIKPGIMACEIDLKARQTIAKFGYEDKFIHSTGHGVGLDIHELPNINKRSQTILQEGMVFSIEPGIYLEGEFGVRIEDVVVVTKNGCEIL